MPNSPLAGLTAKTAGEAALLYGAVSPYDPGDDRKVAMTDAGAVMLEAASDSVQRTALGVSILARGSGLLQGHNVAATYSSSVFNWGSLPITQNGVVASLDLGGTTLSLVAVDDDGSPPYAPGANSVVVVTYSSGTSNPYWPSLSGVISAINSAAVALGYTATIDVNGRLLFTASDAGTGTPPATYISGAGYVDAYSAPVSGVGPSGAITEVDLVVQVNGYTVKPVKVSASGAGVDVEVEIALKTSAEDYFPIVTNLTAMSVPDSPAVSGNYAEWVDGRADTALVARMVGSAPEGGSLTILAIVELIDV